MEYGLIGERLGHSFSKTVHNSLADYNYELKEIAPQNLESFMLKKDFKAINVTIPYKQAVIPFLDEISDTAKEIGAVNTVVNKKGRLIGHNTDFSGLKELIIRNKIVIKDKKVLILGSGGTSKTAKAVAEKLGAERVYRLSRKGGEGLITYTEALKSHTDAQVIINTTPVGMYPNMGDTAIDITAFPRLEGVIDAVYNPLSSALVVEARKRGIRAAGGLYMLIAQAVFAAELFLDASYPETEIQRIYKEILREKQNIVLIGMPSCGKTTIGKELARALNKDFLDCEEEIVRRQGITISEIFALQGEKALEKLKAWL